MAQVGDGIFIGRQASGGPELFWIWHDQPKKTEVWIYDITSSGYSWPGSGDPSKTLYLTYEQAAPPGQGDKAAFELWVQTRSGLPASDLLVQVMTY